MKNQLYEYHRFLLWLVTGFQLRFSHPKMPNITYAFCREVFLNSSSHSKARRAQMGQHDIRTFDNYKCNSSIDHFIVYRCMSTNGNLIWNELQNSCQDMYINDFRPTALVQFICLFYQNTCLNFSWSMSWLLVYILLA